MKSKFSRRDILKIIGIAGSSAMLYPLISCAKNTDTETDKLTKNSSTSLNNNQTMLTRIIPSSGEQLPVVGLGTWKQFDVESTESMLQPLQEVLKIMVEYGGKVIDSSPMYGKSEQVIGDLTTEPGIADKLFYATKVWTSGEQNGIEQMEESMKKMNRKTMDLMQIHNLVDWKTHLKTLKNWKEENKIRYIGITHYTESFHDELKEIIKAEQIDFVQFNYSINVRNAEKTLLETAKDKGVAVIINEPYDKGNLFSAVKGKDLPEWSSEYDIKSWGQYFLKYIISHPAVTCVIPGTSNPKHLADNMAAGYGKIPDEDGRKKMIEYFEK